MPGLCNRLMKKRSGNSTIISSQKSTFFSQICAYQKVLELTCILWREALNRKRFQMRLIPAHADSLTIYLRVLARSLCFKAFRWVIGQKSHYWNFARGQRRTPRCQLMCMSDAQLDSSWKWMTLQDILIYYHLYV